MPRVPLSVAGNAYLSASTRLAAQECVNMFAKVPETEGALNTVALFASQGIELLATLPTGPYRGHETLDDELYVVCGAKFYKIHSDFTYTDLGSVTGSGRCSMTSNGVTIAIQVPSGDGYWYDVANGLQVITDATYQSFQAQDGGILSVTNKDGYFVYITEKEGFLSDLVTLDGGRGFPELTFFTAEIRPDNNTVVGNIRNELYVVGRDTIELFQNTGTGESQPFQRIENATIDKGSSSQFTFIEHLDNFVFLGGGKQEQVSAYRGSPGGSVKISTSAIDKILNGFTEAEIQDAYAFSYQEDGEFFVGFTVKDTTIVYDSTASTYMQRPMWHTRTSPSSSLGQWRCAAVADAYAKNVVFDTEDGRIGCITSSIGTEYGENVERRFSSQYLANNSAPMIVNEIEVRTGTETITSDTQTIKLEASFDGGVSFRDYGSVSIGTSSDPGLRQIWRRIGRVPYQVVFRLTTTNQDATDILQMFAEVEGGQKWL